MVEETTRLLEAATLIPVAVGGFFLNGITVAVFYNRPALRSPSNRFVLSLVGANFVCVVILTPLAVLTLSLREPIPQWLQGTAVFAETFAVTTSVFSTLAISLDRYNAVLSPLHYTMNITRQRSRCLIALVWILSACISGPAFCGQSACFIDEFETFKVFYSGILCAVGFLIPVLTLCRVYAKMYKAAHRNSERTRRQSLQTSAGEISRGGSMDSQFPPVVTAADLIRTGKPPTLAQISKRRCSNASISALLFREEGKAVKTALMVIGNFIFCWGPFFLYLLIETCCVRYTKPSQYLAVLAAIFNSLLSPFLYVYRNEIARNEGLRILFWWRRESGGMYKGNVLQQACKEGDTKAIEVGIRVRHQTSSNCDSMSVQSFSLPPPFSPDCKQCAEIPQPPTADFVATYEVLDEESKPVTEQRPRTRGESVTFKLAMAPQRKCGMCVRQNSDSSSGSGYPLLRDSDSPGRRPETLSRGSSFEDSPTFRGRCCDSPRLPPSLEIEESLPHEISAFQFQVPGEGSSPESVYASAEGFAERLQNLQNLQNSASTRRDLVFEKTQNPNNQQVVSLPSQRPIRAGRRLQRLPAVEDEEVFDFKTSAIIPYDFG